MNENRENDVTIGAWPKDWPGEGHTRARKGGGKNFSGFGVEGWKVPETKAEA